MNITQDVIDSWRKTISEMVPIQNISNALDIGCGQGIFSAVLSDMGVDSITGIDISEDILKVAKENCQDYENISFFIEVHMKRA